MSKNIFVDVHVLQTVPPACINRDDTGSPKTALFGGVQRARVSSQAWKKATRNAFHSEEYGKLDLVGSRTKNVVAVVAEKVQELQPGVEEEQAVKAAVEVLKAAGLKITEPKRKKNAEPDEEPGLPTVGYLVFLSRGQIEALGNIAVAFLGGEKIEKKAAKEAMLTEQAVAQALFGRMLADDPSLNIDASCQVAHAISVHEARTEFDYYTAVDDHGDVDNSGAAMIGTNEFTSSTLYRYATVAVPQLSENLGSAEAAAESLKAFVRGFVLSMPTGKQNTFANRTRPGFVYVAVRTDQPANLAGAFETPVRGGGEAVLPKAVSALAKFAVSEDTAFQTSPVWGAYVAVGNAARTAAEALAATQVTFEELLDGLQKNITELQGEA